LAAITCQGLTKHYGKGKIVALDNLDLNVQEGSIFGFLGPNGAGKTTALKIITGLSKPTSGSAQVGGIAVGPHSLPLQNTIGYLPEEPAFYNWMTGREFLIFVGEIFRLPSAENKKRCEELLELVELTGDASRRIGGYSRGMRQRLGIAQALMNKPPILFLDEPCSALDPFGRVEILDMLTRLKKEETTVFMSSHILADIERVCDTVGIINKGKLIVESPIDELRQRFATTIFELEFEEPGSPLVSALESIPWVQNIEVMEDGSDSKLRVNVSDVNVAKKELPRLVVENGLSLCRYQLITPNLEEVFMELLRKKEE